jgi:small subunit ribosomal protein S17
MSEPQTAAVEIPAAEPKAKNTRTLVGKVVSDKRSKTITVLIERRTKHELYGKIVAKSSKYHAHDEHNEYKMGDVVEIAEPRPISTTKAWTVTRRVQKAIASASYCRSSRRQAACRSKPAAIALACCSDMRRLTPGSLLVS